MFKANPGDINGEKYYLFVDEYGGRGYIPLETSDIANPNWKVAQNYDLPASPRHGTVIPITAAELESLGSGPASGSGQRRDGEMLRYDFDGIRATVVTTSRATARTAPSRRSDLERRLAELRRQRRLRRAARQHARRRQGRDGRGGCLDRLGPAATTSSTAWATRRRREPETVTCSHGQRQYRTSIATGNWTTEQTVAHGLRPAPRPVGAPRRTRSKATPPRSTSTASQVEHGDGHDRPGRHRKAVHDRQLPRPVELRRRQQIQGQVPGVRDLRPRAHSPPRCSRSPAASMRSSGVALADADRAEDRPIVDQDRAHGHVPGEAGDRPDGARAGVRHRSGVDGDARHPERLAT